MYCPSEDETLTEEVSLPVIVNRLPSNVKLASPFTDVASTLVINRLLAGFVYVKILAETNSVSTVPELVKIKLLLESSAKKLAVVAVPELIPSNFIGLELAEICKFPLIARFAVGDVVPIPTLL